MKIDKTGIYIDAYNLRKLLKRAQFTMTKADRVVYGTPLLQACAAFLADFVMAYDFPDERSHYIRKMCADFEVLKIDLRIIVEDNVIKQTDKENAQMSPDAYKVRIFELVGRMDDGITKWRNSTKGKTATD